MSAALTLLRAVRVMWSPARPDLLSPPKLASTVSDKGTDEAKPSERDDAPLLRAIGYKRQP